MRRGFRASPTALHRPTDHQRLFVLLPSSLHSPLMSPVPSLLPSLPFSPSIAQTQTFVANPCSDQKNLCSPLPVVFALSLLFSVSSLSKLLRSLHLCFLLLPFRLLVIRLTLPMWRWSASNPDSEPRLIGDDCSFISPSAAENAHTH